MPLNANHMVTLTALRYDGEQDTEVEVTHRISGASWYGQTAASPGSGGLVPGSLYKVRIFAPGLAGYEPCGSWQRLSAKEKAARWSVALGDKVACEGTQATVTAIHDNRSARRNPHIYLEAR